MFVFTGMLSDSDCGGRRRRMATADDDDVMLFFPLTISHIDVNYAADDGELWHGTKTEYIFISLTVKKNIIHNWFNQ